MENNNMPFDYLASFPIPSRLLPQRLLSLLSPVNLSPEIEVEVACMYEIDPDGDCPTYLRLLMAVVPGADGGPIDVLDESEYGVVRYSTPFDEYGCMADISPSISGYDYIVASWGDDSFFTFNLAEKVWMTLGLTPRCIGNTKGNDAQKIIYDDMRVPKLEIAKGEVSTAYRNNQERTISWKMANEYLRRYFWLCGARGVRVFFYSFQMQDIPEIRKFMNGENQIVIVPERGPKWYKLDIREVEGGLLLQLWASVEAVMPELCQVQGAGEILWPGDTQPMSRNRARALYSSHFVYLKDQFLEKYENDKQYDATPVRINGHWHCGPAYRGSWHFLECRRVGRNLIRVPIYKLYEGIPDREIVHARKFAISPDEIVNIDLKEEHIVAKVQRLLDALLLLGDGLSALSEVRTPAGWIGFDRAKLKANKWAAYPELCELARVVPLELSEENFLSRCKRLHEIWQRIPNGDLKRLLTNTGCPTKAIEGLQSIKLLQVLLNIIQKLNADHETYDSFVSPQKREGWDRDNYVMAPLFLNYDLRNADAHVIPEKCLPTLQKLGIDTAGTSSGYGKAFDSVMDGVIDSLRTLAEAIDKLMRIK